MMFILGIFLTTLFGWLILSLMKLPLSWQEKIGSGYVLGFGTHSLIYFFLIYSFDHSNALLYWLSLLVSVAALFFAHAILKTPLSGFNKPSFKVHPISVLSWLVIFTLFAITLIYSSSTPVYTTDSLHLYDFRAKVIYVTGSLSAVKDYVISWYTYPPFTSLANLFSRFWGQTDSPSVVYPFLYLAFALSFYSYLRRRTSPQLASIGTLALYSSPLTLWQSRLDGLTNLPYTIFFCLAVIYLLQAFENRQHKTSYLIISSLFLGLSTWTRSLEPLWLSPLIWLILMAKLHRSWLHIFLYVHIFQTPHRLWVRFITYYDTVPLSNRFKPLVDQIFKPQNANPTPTTATPLPNPEPVTVQISNVVQLPSPFEQIYSHFVEASSLFFGVILHSLTPAIYVVIPILAVDLITGSFRRYQHLLFITLLVFGLIWGGTVFTSLSPDFSDYWHELDNALSRMSGVLLPLLWLIIFQSSVWHYLPFLNQDRDEISLR